MQLTITLADELMGTAREYSLPDTSDEQLIAFALETFIRVEAGRRLSALGGTRPDMRDIPRRRPDEA